jgi:hypothetical protein
MQTIREFGPSAILHGGADMIQHSTIGSRIKPDTDLSFLLDCNQELDVV